MPRGGSQNRRIRAKLVLRMDGYRASQRRTHPDDSHAAIVADLKFTAEPSVLNEAFCLNEAIFLGAGVDVHVWTEAPRIEIGWTEPAQMLQRAAREDVQDVLVIEIARRQESVAFRYLVNFRHRERASARGRSRRTGCRNSAERVL